MASLVAHLSHISPNMMVSRGNDSMAISDKGNESFSYCISSGQVRRSSMELYSTTLDQLAQRPLDQFAQPYAEYRNNHQPSGGECYEYGANYTQEVSSQPNFSEDASNSGDSSGNSTSVSSAMNTPGEVQNTHYRDEVESYDDLASLEVALNKVSGQEYSVAAGQPFYPIPYSAPTSTPYYGSSKIDTMEPIPLSAFSRWAGSAQPQTSNNSQYLNPVNKSDTADGGKRGRHSSLGSFEGLSEFLEDIVAEENIWLSPLDPTSQGDNKTPLPQANFTRLLSNDTHFAPSSATTTFSPVAHPSMDPNDFQTTCGSPDSMSNAQNLSFCEEVSTKLRRTCSHPGCSNRIVQGGLCIGHGAKRKTCNHPGCSKRVKQAGFCSTHGPARRRCGFEGCTKVAVQGGRCVSHGAKKKMCSRCGCERQAVKSGRCKRHFDEDNGLGRTRAPAKKKSKSPKASVVTPVNEGC